MNRLERALRLVQGELARTDLGWAVVGAVAVSARTRPRFTQDLDLAVAVEEDARAESLIARLVTAGYEVLATVEQTETGRLATVRTVPPGERIERMVVDFLFASSGIEAEVVAGAEELLVQPGLPVPVARVEHLIALKVLSRDDRRRPQDVADLRALLEVATADQLERARDALRLIAKRGFAREKALLSELDELLADSAE